MNVKLQGYFKELETNLKGLGKSDSSVEYAPHIRDEFDKVIYSLNKIKNYLGEEEMTHTPDKYFQ
ncbi:hypothetical protein [Bacillus swezeyi]|uniref:Uncharacterized protein n=1 Tax=Bacillus swezeyi TaxID=1925020 RepID=A0A5M8RH28_9BACI|nr:hypothetical protein [Bacillus swezeyi]KAA6446748.1 hypothetical protein DX927_23520 [Bacillus swezeyi]KAA6472304.1 hypothetical protein DX928_22510 [Bacillus swezeyi]MEC0685644.1 hypothetical protein [Bacillus haynesii]TYS32338.1 hypothetical protein FZC77_22135 [Bacillus swezeyi]